MLIKLKYGEKGIDHLDPIEKGYVLGRVTRDMNKPHFAVCILQYSIFLMLCCLRIFLVKFINFVHFFVLQTI